VLITTYLKGRYRSIAGLTSLEATSKAIYCFLKRRIGLAARQLKDRESEAVACASAVSEKEPRPNSLATLPARENGMGLETESFCHKVDAKTYLCMLILRHFDNLSSLTTHESFGELHQLHQSNLKDTDMVARGRSRPTEILDLTRFSGRLDRYSAQVGSSFYQRPSSAGRRPIQAYFGEGRLRAYLRTSKFGEI
jgi:hypothetical protein